MQKYCLEKILNYRTRNGEVVYEIKFRQFFLFSSYLFYIEYFVKLSGYSSEMNTSEPENHLNQSLLASVRESREQISEENVKIECSSKLEKAQPALDDTYCYGFDRGLEAEKVLGK